MKYIKFILALFICYPMDHLVLAAEEIKTTHSFDRENFCAEGAEKKIAYLNNLTKGDVEQIEGLKAKINELEAKKKIITDLQSIRNDYLNAFEAINSETQKAKALKIARKSSIAQFKKLLNKSLTLNAISLVMKDGIKQTDSAVTLKDLCDPNNDSASANTLFCKRYGQQGSWRGAFNDAEINGLNKTIANFSEAMNKIKKKENINLEVKKILDSIPESIKPDGVLEILNVKSPVLLEMLTKSVSKEELINCLDGSEAVCEKLISDPQKRFKIKEILGQEIKSAGDDFSDKYNVVKNQIALQNTADFNSLIHTFDYPLEERDEFNKKLLNEKIMQLKKYSETLFEKNNPGSQKSIKNGLSLIGLSDDEYTNLLNACNIQAKLTEEALSQAFKSCEKQVQLLDEKAAGVKNNLENESEQLKQELAIKLEKNSGLQKIEKMKTFVLERYMRGCKKAPTIQLASNLQQIKCSDIADKLTAPSDQIGSLASMYSKVLGRLQEANTPSKTKGELGLFSKDELKNYMSYCQNTSEKDLEIKEICQKVSQLNSEIASKRELKEWEAFNNKYYVDYNANSEKGYVVYEKKSNVRIIGEGLAPLVGQIVPLWLGNLQMENQINFLTNQAINQKQMNYMYTPFSPWMNSPYFQANYFPMQAVNFNSPYTANTSAGFNFAK